MPGRSIRPLVDQLLGGELDSYLARSRASGMSYYDIARDIEQLVDVRLTAETVRQWCIISGGVG